MVTISTKQDVVVNLSEISPRFAGMTGTELTFVLSNPVFANDQVLGMLVTKTDSEVVVTLEYLNLYKWHEIEPWAKRVIRKALR